MSHFSSRLVPQMRAYGRMEGCPGTRGLHISRRGLLRAGRGVEGVALSRKREGLDGGHVFRSPNTQPTASRSF
jgi:hypothetical protein